MADKNNPPNVYKPMYAKHNKTGSAVTYNEQTTASQHHLKTHSMLSFSKVSERKEEEEESSQKSKLPPRLSLKNTNILELLDQMEDVIEEEEEQPAPQESQKGLKF